MPIGPLILASLALAVSGCSPDDAATEGRCGPDFAAAIHASGALPSPQPEGMPPASVAGEDGVSGHADLAPLLRGDHASLDLTLDPTTCRVDAAPRPYVPFDATDLTAPGRSSIGLDTFPHPLVGGLLVTGRDRGAGDDVDSWDRAFVALRIEAPHLHAPSRQAVFDALVETCGALDPGAVAVIITTGRGTPSGGGALILDREAVGWDSLAAAMAAACGHLGALAWVIDGSWAGDIDLSFFADGPPLTLWRASDALAPDAPRLDVDLGGALSYVLGRRIAAQVGQQCLARARPGPGELWALFDAPAGEVRADIVAARWDRAGVRGLRDLADGAGLTSPIAATTLARALEAQIPATLRLTTAPAPVSDRCVQDADCATLLAACALPPCRTLRCVGGRCAPGVALGAGCDDLNPCTEGDRCDHGGACVGTLVDCADDNPCTVDACEPLRGCVHVPSDDPCDDGDACTEGDRCGPDGRCVGAARVCDDGDPCTLDECRPSRGCVFTRAPLACDDGDPCTISDTCRDGVCRGTDLGCDDGNPCTDDRCEAETGACHFAPAVDHTPCDDGDPCTRADRCDAGVCAGVVDTCDDGLDCTFDVCERGACAALPTPGYCVHDGACVPVGEAPDGAPCLRCVATGSLVAAPELEGAPCDDDGVACTEDLCVGGVCAHLQAPGTCRDPDGACVAVGEALGPCLTCVGTGVAAPAPDGAPCGDGESCDVGRCDGAGFCVPEPAPCCPEAALACGGTVAGDTRDGAPSVSEWGCAPARDVGGHDQSFSFVAPCSGEVVFVVDGFTLLTAYVVDLSTSACDAGECAIGGFTSVVLSAEAGRTYAIVVDGAPGSEGAFTIEARCGCEPDLEPAP